MKLTSKDIAPELYEKYKDIIPGFTVKKAEKIIRNHFFCMAHVIARLGIIAYPQFTIYPNYKQAVRAQQGFDVGPHARKAMLERKNQALAKKNLE